MSNKIQNTFLFCLVIYLFYHFLISFKEYTNGNWVFISTSRVGCL